AAAVRPAARSGAALGRLVAPAIAPAQPVEPKLAAAGWRSGAPARLVRAAAEQRLGPVRPVVLPAQPVSGPVPQPDAPVPRWRAIQLHAAPDRGLPALWLPPALPAIAPGQCGPGRADVRRQPVPAAFFRASTGAHLRRTGWRRVPPPQ